MYQESVTIQSDKIISLPFETVKQIEDYTDVLNRFQIKYSVCGGYLQIGEIPETQGWIIHVSIIKSESVDLLIALLPFLSSQSISFKIIRSAEYAELLLDGRFGLSEIGKIFKIYIPSEAPIVKLVEEIISLTKNFHGPDIVTDYHLCNCVYTRYGAFTPLVLTGENGKNSNFIYNVHGQLIPDLLQMPFLLPEGVAWPFDSIKKYKSPVKKTLINQRYKIISILKSSVKGEVMKALFFKKLLISSCAIKTGKDHISMDDSGRDMRDRLIWQKNVHDTLHHDFQIPKIIEVFRENEVTYLVMEFVKGKPLDTLITEIYAENNLTQSRVEKRLQFLCYVIKVVDIVHRLHKRGYIHRDLSPENFIVDKKGDIWLIDMELSYSVHEGNTSRPFALGTPGFMSPQQMIVSRPMQEDDIYGLGAFMISMFTGLAPNKFSLSDAEKLEEQLFYFLGNKQITNLVIRCLQTNPEDRPSISTIQINLETYKKELSEGLEKMKSPAYGMLSKESLQTLIAMALKGLSAFPLIDQWNLWPSAIKEENGFCGVRLNTQVYSAGLFTGMAGIVYVIANAYSLGFPIGDNRRGFEAAWDFITNNFLSQLPNTPAGLNGGSAGIALAIHEALKNNLLSDISKYKSLGKRCLEIPIYGVDLADGIAGKGMAMLACEDAFDLITLHEKLHSHANVLIDNQLKDGSWRSSVSGKNDKPSSLGQGVAGHLIFLMAVEARFKNGKYTISIERGLNWLMKKYAAKGSAKFWQNSSTEKKEGIGLLNGSTGISLVFIKAFELFGKGKYRQIAEEALSYYPDHFTHPNFSLADGLAGLGEVYLEAYKKFRTPCWIQRADWIANLFYHTKMELPEKVCHWSVDDSSVPTADLMTGGCGIIHFLLKYLKTRYQ